MHESWFECFDWLAIAPWYKNQLEIYNFTRKKISFPYNA